MIDEEEWMDINALRCRGHTYAEIGRMVGRDWRTVKRYLEEGAQPVYRRRKDAPSMLDPFKCVVDGWLERKPNLRASRVHQDLVRDYSFSGGYQIVQRYVRDLRAAKDPGIAEERFETAPVHQAQVDWSHEEPILTPEGLALPLYCFHMVLSHSRDAFCSMVWSMDLATFWGCHRAAFSHFGGVLKEILYDRTKTVVRQHVGSERGLERRLFHPEALASAMHYGFRMRLCRPYRAKTKRKVESDVDYVRGRPAVRSTSTRRCSGESPVAEMMSERIRNNARELKLLGLAENLDDLVGRTGEGDFGYRQFLDLLLEEEIGVLEGRKYASRLKLSGLPYRKTLSQFDRSFQPELDPKRLKEFESLRFVEKKVNVLVLGPPGVGKAHIAAGLAMEALRRGNLVRYVTLDDLVRDLRRADQLGKLREKLAHYQRPQLLICDEVGYLPLAREDANRFLQLVNRYYIKGSMVVTSNKRVSKWAELFGEEVLAAAILDRLLHDAEILTINGPSYRLHGRLEVMNEATEKKGGEAKERASD